MMAIDTMRLCPKCGHIRTHSLRYVGRGYTMDRPGPRIEYIVMTCSVCGYVSNVPCEDA